MKQETIHERCVGCQKVQKDSTCSVYLKPSVLWNRGTCPLANHVKVETKSSNGKVRAGQQKGKKKSRGK